MTRLTRLLLLTLSLSSAALAEPTTLTPFASGNAWVISAGELLRYTSDPRTNTLLLPDARLAPEAKLPEGVTVQQRAEGLAITLPPGATYGLSPDGKHLIITPARAEAVTAIPADERTPIFYPLANADANTVAALLGQLYPNLRVQVDARQRALIVLATPGDRALVEGLIKQLDTARPQVMFEAEILEVNQDTTQALGLQYDSIFTFKLTEDAVPSLTRLGGLSRNPLSLSVGLNALKTNGAARVLAQPRVTTLDGLEARINSTQTTPVIVPGATGTQSVQNITTGITLRMTPKVAPDGTVEATLSISVSTPTGTTSQGVPQFSSREASTTVRVRNGEPIAIGGLLENRRVEGGQKVPLLGDIPVLGKLFTTTRTETHRSDLVIVVTPRLVVSPNVR
ncbi:type II secretion system protein GspD [Deinococcus wulumuqiensis]|uniref:Type II secretion system protein GspD n=1 Tax=Deinococcus wulumuqiensis TaxID=980427 RepID=A0A345IMF4_9DEIO|nr:secretin N-terminal domain-containing protein [Deinococcus wulumuqiensis]AXH00877.1 type II secretion system protein GspD [Deinococcus wulumuqiensis]